MRTGLAIVALLLIAQVEPGTSRAQDTRRPRSSGRRFRPVKARAVAGSPAGLEVRARPNVLSPYRRNTDVDARRVPRYNWRTSGSGIPAPGATQRFAAAGREWEERAWISSCSSC